MYQNNYNVTDEYKNMEVSRIREIARNTTLPFACATFNLRGDLNLGTIMRTAHLCGARHMYIFGHRGYDRRSTVGAQNWISNTRVDEVKTKEDIVEYLRSDYYTPVFVEQGGQNLFHVADFWYPPHPCFVFGPEDAGLPFIWGQRDKVLSIPQRGVMRSHNVAVAAGIVMFHYAYEVVI